MQAQININADMAAKLGVSERNTSAEVNAAAKQALYAAFKLPVPVGRDSADAELAQAEYDLLSLRLRKHGKLSTVDANVLTRRARQLRKPNPLDK